MKQCSSATNQRSLSPDVSPNPNSNASPSTHSPAATTSGVHEKLTRLQMEAALDVWVLETWQMPNNTENRTEAKNRILNCWDAIQTQPDSCPAKNLRLSSLGLTNLPECIGQLSSLQTLNLNNNQLTSLPENITQLSNLQTLDFSYNQLTSLPESILMLPQNCTIYLTASHLSAAVRNRLEQTTSLPSYNGPLIEIDMGNRPTTHTIRPIQEAVLAWVNELQKNKVKIVHLEAIQFTSFQTETYAPEFSQFLDRLRETKDYLNPETKEDFQKRVGALLVQIHNDTELRGLCFNLAQDAINTCGDRVGLRMLNMESACLEKIMLTEIKNGKFDKNLGDVLAYVTAQYRYQVLANAAAAKVLTLNLVDEIEVVLGFIVAFRREFQLPVNIKAMLYPTCSSLLPEDIIATRAKLTNMPFTTQNKEDNYNHVVFSTFFNGEVRDSKAIFMQPTQETSADEQRQNNAALMQFVVTTPAITAWLQRFNPDGFKFASDNLGIEIANNQNKLYEELETLEANDPSYQENCQNLRKKFNDIEASSKLQFMGPLLDEACKQHNIKLVL